MRILNLDKLQEGVPDITPIVGAFCMEAAMVCLVRGGHSSGVILIVQGDFELKLKIVWKEVLNPNAFSTWAEEAHAATYAAMGIAFLLAQELLGYTIFEESRYGTGIDYWMGKGEIPEERPTFFQKEARLEISGISKETPSNTVNMRVNKKKKQISPSDKSNLPGWVIVIEFGTPKSKIEKK